MVRHNNPGFQPITLSLEKKQGVLYSFRNLGLRKPTLAGPGIQVMFDSLAALDASPGLGHGCQLVFPAVENSFGERIGQAEGNCLRDGSPVKVGKIAPGMPSFGRVHVWERGHLGRCPPWCGLEARAPRVKKRAPRWIGAPLLEVLWFV
jgi:hypothetical protein